MVVGLGQDGCGADHMRHHDLDAAGGRPGPQRHGGRLGGHHGRRGRVWLQPPQPAGQHAAREAGQTGSTFDYSETCFI